MDKIIITILEDGTVKTETDQVSMPNHSNAEKALLLLQRSLGGTTTERKIGQIHTHGHEHSHEHGSEHNHH